MAAEIRFCALAISCSMAALSDADLAWNFGLLLQSVSLAGRAASLAIHFSLALRIFSSSAGVFVTSAAGSDTALALGVAVDAAVPLPAITASAMHVS